MIDTLFDNMTLPPLVLPSSCGAGGNSDSVFDVEKSVGTIIIAKPLDAEQRSFFNLTVQATDGTNIAYTQVPQLPLLTSLSLFGVLDMYLTTVHALGERLGKQVTSQSYVCHSGTEKQSFYTFTPIDKLDL